MSNNVEYYFRSKRCNPSEELNVDSVASVGVSGVNGFQQWRSHRMQRQGQESSIWVAVTDEDTRVHGHTHKHTHTQNTGDSWREIVWV